MQALELIRDSLLQEAKADLIGDNACRVLEGRKPRVMGDAFYVKTGDVTLGPFADKLERVVNRLYGVGAIAFCHIQRGLDENMMAMLSYAFCGQDVPQLLLDKIKERTARHIAVDSAQRHGPRLEDVTPYVEVMVG